MVSCALPVGIAAQQDTKTILFLGDSLTAGYGLMQEQSFPNLIGGRLKERDLPFEVVNAGVPGDTSAGGLRRIDWLLRRRIDILVLELGANDMLRGLPLELTSENLQSIINSAPPPIGSQIKILKRCCEKSICVLPLSQPDQPTEQCSQSDDHCECVGVQIAGLNLAHDARKSNHCFCCSIDKNAVDYQLVALLPKELTYGSTTTGKAFYPQVIEIVFAIKQGVETR